jgi:hypothetical protein
MRLLPSMNTGLALSETRIVEISAGALRRTTMVRRVAYIHSPELETLGNIGTHPAGRSSRVHRLIESLDLLKVSSDGHQTGSDGALSVAKCVQAVPTSRADLLRYHSQDFVGE